jgi:serine/threonine protein kinase
MNTINDFMINELKNFKEKKTFSEKKKVMIEAQPYFLKMAGKSRQEQMKNEIKSFDKLKKISFYKDYFITSITKGNKTAILLKYIKSKNLEFLFQCDLDEITLLSLYKCLLEKLKIFHDNDLSHGDIKPANFIIYKKNRKPEIELIDTETVIDLSDPKDIGLDTYMYIPFYNKSVYRVDIHYKKAFSTFSKYRDVYALSLFILYLYNKDLYQKVLKNNSDPTYQKVGKLNRFIFDKLTYPSDYVSNKNKLEKILYFVFSKIDRHNYADALLNEKPQLLPSIDNILSYFT